MAGLLDSLAELNRMATNAAMPSVMSLLPTNAKMLAKSIVMPTGVSNADLSPNDINVLQNAYLNTQNRVNRPITQDYRNRLEDMQSLDSGDQVFSQILPNNKIVPVGLEQELLKRQISPTLQYQDYPTKKGTPEVAQAGLVKSITDPAYSMQTTIGRAKYVTDPQGNIHVVDTYDFPKSAGMDDYGTWNKGFAIAHGIGEKFSNTMPVDINIGTIDQILKKRKTK